MSRVVTFRVEDPLYAQLHEFAQRSSLSEGQAARFLTEVGLGKTPQDAAISVYMRALSARLKAPIRAALKTIKSDLERFAKAYGGEMEFERVEPREEEIPEEETMTPEEAGESGMFDQDEPAAEERGESGAFDREPEVPAPPAGLSGKKRRRGRRGGKR